ncbi:hypothetical protein ACQCSU_14675 [Pseudarthrobacter sp. O4]|uniref:hypothetical protein n=1 Tax=Pseudarthrobacter sp. O4 TaxID=3418417 RepID=UPI003CF62A8D
MAASTLRNYINAIVYMVAWAHEHGVPLEVETVFTPLRVEHYIQTGTEHLVPNSRGTRRSSLIRVGRHVTRKVAWTPPALKFPVAQLSPPYSAEEVKRYFRMAAQQGTEFCRRVATAQLCLGLGAGLRADEYLLVGSESLVLHDEVFMLDIPGARARKVPMHIRYVDPLLEIADANPNEPFMGPLTGTSPMNRLDGMLSKPHYPRVRRPTTNKLRTTWLLRMLRSRCTLSEILYMSGLRNTKSLIELAAHVQYRDTDEWFVDVATFHD